MASGRNRPDGGEHNMHRMHAASSGPPPRRAPFAALLVPLGVYRAWAERVPDRKARPVRWLGPDRFLPVRLPCPAAVSSVALLVALAASGTSAQPSRPAPEGAPAETRPAVADSGAVPLVLAPRTVLRRALVAPGWGQLTNRQPVKAVAVWGGLAATGAGVGVSHVQYLRLRHAALYRRCESEPTAAVCADVAAYADEAARYPGIPAATLRTLRDNTRRRRDLFILGTAVVYALQGLDAYVSAHLRQFDDGSDLSVGMTPVDGQPGLALRITR